MAGGKVLLSEGVFTLADEIAMASKAGVMVEGSGRFATTTPSVGTVVRQGAVNIDVFSLSGCQGVTFRDFSCYNAIQTAGSTGFKLAASCNNIVFDNLYLMRLEALFDLSGECTEIFWHGVQGGQGTTDYGIKAISCQDLYIDGGTFLPCGAVDGVSFYFKDVDFANIIGCSIRDSGYGIWLESSGAPMHTIRIIGNTIGALDRAGIRMYANANDLYHVIISDNQFDNCSIAPATGGVADTHDANISGEGAGGGALQDITITHNQFARGAAHPYYGMYLASLGRNKIRDNDLAAGYHTVPISMPAQAGGWTSPRNNSDYITENSGTATLVNGQVAIVVAHGLSVTPAAGDIMVTPMESLGAASEFYIDTYGAANFTIHVDANPTQDVDFAWKAVVL